MNWIPDHLRRLTLCWLTLCVAAVGAMPYALPRPAEAEMEAETNVEEVADPAATVRSDFARAARRRPAAPDAPADQAPGRCPSRPFAATSMLRPSLRTLEVRIQV